MYVIYGIPNCDTVKKTLNWLKKHQVNYAFHDYKKEGITAEKLKTWSRQAGWENLLNKKGATWRKLDEATQASITTEDKAIDLMIRHTSIIRRPLIEQADKVVMLGFDETAYQEAFIK